ncbi:hypothetical protein SAMN04488570_2122 [Nocardioides scoriae]|uniref:Uncharacterized protein n=1 Tax=Nocardioides scoriae TaxID=642780 RepID=A0A1H1T2Y7_9ACTN|nr:hypothetical protein [Nocardioides scoriae]SDS54531.1 hypothetical protein SAMN04488570_2122 [Nocardioides scoriae]
MRPEDVVPQHDLSPAAWLLGELTRPGPLVRHTTTPERCWCTFWEGFALPPAWDRAPRLRFPHRDQLLFEAPLSELEAVTEAFGRVGYAEPTLWWPEDRAWVVHWEVDSDATYAACPGPAAADLVAAGIGAHEVDGADAITLEG